MSNPKQLKEKFEKDFWSKQDDNLTPLEFSSKWWLAERKALLEEIKEEIKKEHKNFKVMVKANGIMLESDEDKVDSFNEGLDTALTIIQSKE